MILIANRSYGSMFIILIASIDRPFCTTFNMIPTRHLIYYLCAGVICYALISNGCQSKPLGPTKPSGYRITIPDASQVGRFQPLTLSVHVTDVSGMPVDNIPVSFHLPQSWTTAASLDPPTVLTHNGKASTTFRAQTAGHVTLGITVENLTETVHITVVGETPRF